MNTDLRSPYRLKLASTPAQQAELRNFIQNAYQREFAARIPHFLPLLAGLYNADNTLIAACGLNPASQGRLYLEHYLEQTIESLLRQKFGTPVRRDTIFEVGNLAADTAGAGRLMFAALVQLLRENAQDWVVFTGTIKLRNSFRHLHLKPVELVEARADKIGSDASDWGSYYRCRPWVMAGDLQQGHQVLTQNSLLLSLFGPMPAVPVASAMRAAS